MNIIFFDKIEKYALKNRNEAVLKKKTETKHLTFFFSFKNNYCLIFLFWFVVLIF